MDELHSEMRIIQTSIDDKHRSESSSTESSEMASQIPKYVFQLSHPQQTRDTVEPHFIVIYHGPKSELYFHRGERVQFADSMLL